ncbi:MAG: hypothetical protein K8S97_12385 [Anaerolineae bacterium]|nr:hypothetical protein [Anaerolineae bacterium]
MRTMRTFTTHDYNTYWEYKIVRARHGEFARRDYLIALLRQEARAGWIMTEKYSDGQVRFKRPRSARAGDRYLPPTIDPYRTVFVATPHLASQNLHLFALAITLVMALIAIALLVLLVSLPG